MNDTRRLIERIGEGAPFPDEAFERMLRRRDRKRRNERLVAGSVGIAVFVAAIAVLLGGNPFDRSDLPAVPSPSPTPIDMHRPPLAANGDITFVSADVVDFSDRLSDFGILSAVDPGGGKPRKILDIDCPFPGETTSCDTVGISSVDWSPDGTRVAYALWGSTDAGLGERKGIYVMEIASQQVHQLTSCVRPCVFQDDVDWSPDGSRIAFRQADVSGCDWMNSFDGVCSIYTMKSDGTDQVKLPTGSVIDPISPSWSPDGASIAFSGRVGEDWFVYTMATDGSEPTRLAADLPSPEQTQPAWSPDGSTIAFVVWEGAAEGSKPTGLDKEYGLPCDLWLMAPDGSERRRVIVDCALIGGAGFGVQGPEWSPDGTKILLLAGTGGSLQVIDADTTEVSSIEETATGPIAWQPRPQESP
jgi:Tol biopolymer transport system component